MSLLINCFVLAFLLNFTINAKKPKRSVILTVFGTIIFTIGIYAYLWLVNISFTGIANGYYNAGFLPILVYLIAIIPIILKDSDKLELGIYGIKVIAFISMIVIVATTPMLHSDELYDLPEETIITNISEGNSLSEVNQNNIPTVNKDVAYTIMKGNVPKGSLYFIREKDIKSIDVNGEQFWVAQLQFNNPYIWWKYHTTCGFIMVSEEDPTKEPTVVDNLNIRYLETACLNDNIYRHVFLNGYENYKLSDGYNFEVDDNLNPRYVFSLVEPTVINTGWKVTGVLIVDPVTGDMKEYGMNEIPEWVDQVIPEYVAKDYVTWKGKYKDGWKAQYFNKENVVKPTNGICGEDLWFIKGENYKNWYTGMTSVSDEDDTLTGISFVDGRTGKLYTYKVSSLFGTNEEGIVNAVENKFKNYDNYYASVPIPRIYNGKLIYITPVSASGDSGSTFEYITITDPKTKEVIVGETKTEVIKNYQRYLKENGFDNPISITDTFDGETIDETVKYVEFIVENSNTYVWIYMNNSSHIFEIYPTDYPEAVFTKSGDHVIINYENTQESVISVTTFENYDLDVFVSENYIEFSNEEDIKDELTDKYQEIEDIKDKRKEIESQL